MGQSFPVDAIIPELLTTLHGRSVVILQAPPGAGKTTRVPLALLEPAASTVGTIIMLEPRRLAAVNAARWMAHCLHEPVGQTVGYAIRFERCCSSATRIEVVTEGILTRRLQTDPELRGVGTVIFDEFHERSIHGDTALALCREIQEHLRPDLRIIVMSATLDPAPLAQLLGTAPVLTVTVPTHHVAMRYLPDDDRDIALRTARGVVRAVRETEGDILAFLPGSGEIHRCRDYLAELLSTVKPLQIVPLYGDLPFAEQQRALLPGPRRRIILATNIAETSLTIEGVTVVVDSGMQRLLHHDAGRGVNRLVTARISAASATQRAGRAGRLAPGTCYRLWSAQAHAALLAFTPPEICGQILLNLLCSWRSGGYLALTVLPGSIRPRPAPLRKRSVCSSCCRPLMTRCGSPLSAVNWLAFRSIPG
jgi:ATP-dependent helicase HrpB